MLVNQGKYLSYILCPPKLYKDLRIGKYSTVCGYHSSLAKQISIGSKFEDALFSFFISSTAISSLLVQHKGK